ncbi:AAA family ATPase [Cryptosporangium sp. NPDC051539]|uniref:AAA family ATPase n=1 Tax=Cryptosporangium sp. NPDC051539 TaxID=3363962 RepID=UPI0037A9E553
MSWVGPYLGDGEPRPLVLPPAPPWRQSPRPVARTVFQPPAGLVDAVNAALRLRRPLLVTGAPGSGKSTLVEAVSDELGLGRVLRWHITSRTVVTDGLYHYDVLGRIHAQQLRRAARGDARGRATRALRQRSGDGIGPYLRLGPLGTALLPGDQPRALLIDEIDKSDLDLPSDLLDVLERGSFEIPELARYEQDTVDIREWDGPRRHSIRAGQVRCVEFPFIVMTSNGERDFPAPFLRRCIRYQMPRPTAAEVTAMVRAHLGTESLAPAPVTDLIAAFVERLDQGESLAVDQLLNAVFLLTGPDAPEGMQREGLVTMLMRELSRA